MNPLLADWNTPFGLPPFGSIADADFAPAFDAGLAEARASVDRVAADPAEPTFANTVEALERSDRSLGRVSAVFYGLAGAHTNDTLEALQRELSPKLAAHQAETLSHPGLFARIDALMARKAELGLSAEQERVLTLYHRMFARAGARLGEAERERLKAIQQRLASLTTGFGQNVLADERAWELALAPADLEGLPADLVAAMAEAAQTRAGTGTSSPCRGASSSPSCSSRPGATCARPPSRRGRPGGRTAARPTTGRSSPRSSRSAPSWRGSSATPTMRASSSSRRWRRRPRRCAPC